MTEISDKTIARLVICLVPKVLPFQESTRERWQINVGELHWNHTLGQLTSWQLYWRIGFELPPGVVGEDSLFSSRLSRIQLHLPVGGVRKILGSLKFYNTVRVIFKSGPQLSNLKITLGNANVVVN